LSSSKSTISSTDGSTIGTTGSFDKLLNTGDKGLVRFRFAYYPELLKAGATIMFREGRTKGLGYVTRVFPNKIS
jgi:GTPase